jgi:hypothetical protein
MAGSLPLTMALFLIRAVIRIAVMAASGREA